MAEGGDLRDLVKSLNEKIDSLVAQAKTPNKSRKIDVPLPCQKAVRRVIKQLSTSDDPISINYDRIKDNAEACNQVVEETRRVFKDMWSRGVVAAAFTNVITNIKHEKRREANGKTAVHRVQAKTSRRKRAKLERRKKALKHIDWSPDSKRSLEECLRMDITSPERTDDEDPSSRLRLPFVWESSKLCKGKIALDRLYREKVLKTESARRQLVFVQDAPQDTVTDPPSNCPPWAISREFHF